MRIIKLVMKTREHSGCIFFCLRVSSITHRNHHTDMDLKEVKVKEITVASLLIPVHIPFKKVYFVVNTAVCVCNKLFTCQMIRTSCG